MAKTVFHSCLLPGLCLSDRPSAVPFLSRWWVSCVLPLDLFPKSFIQDCLHCYTSYKEYLALQTIHPKKTVANLPQERLLNQEAGDTHWRTLTPAKYDVQWTKVTWEHKAPRVSWHVPQMTGYLRPTADRRPLSPAGSLQWTVSPFHAAWARRVSHPTWGILKDEQKF